MKRKQSILVPLDGSATALRALEHACRRVHDGESASITGLNVQAPMPPSRLVTRGMIADHQARESRTALRGARALAKRLRIPVEWQVVVGAPAPTIARFAREHGCVEIVMGTRGLGRLPGFVLGSTAMRVVQLAEVPVTLVK
ncbi:MAG: universal stress protein [Steroidobacteraceae bacterium]